MHRCSAVAHRIPGQNERFDGETGQTIQLIQIGQLKKTVRKSKRKRSTLRGRINIRMSVHFAVGQIQRFQVGKTLWYTREPDAGADVVVFETQSADLGPGVRRDQSEHGRQDRRIAQRHAQVILGQHYVIIDGETGNRIIIITKRYANTSPGT